MASSQSRFKVAVIGAGAAGLCAGRHLLAEPDKFEFDIFEQQNDVGGTWRYSNYIGQDQYGLPVHSSMYKNLRTNLPKEVMAFPDFPFGKCDGRSFLHHSEILQYLVEYAKHFQVYDRVKFFKLVENVRPLQKSDGTVEWAVSFSDVISKEKESYIYDAVMVCNGHYSVPYMPSIVGLNDFQGKMIHSHDYRHPEDFKNMTVVVLGAGASGLDIAIEISQFANKVILSHNSPPKTALLPSNVTQEKGIDIVSPKSVTFLCGKQCSCDALIICTGYLYNYPFLDPTCNVKIGDQKVTPLFLHLFHTDFPTLAIWAIPKLILPFPMFDQQVKVFVKFLKGQIQLPSREEMRKVMEEDFTKRIQSGLKPRHAHLMQGQWQWEYDNSLSKVGEIEPIRNSVRNLYRYVHYTRTQDLVHYKNNSFHILDDESFEIVE